MLFDWVYVVSLAFFLLKGYRKGFILALFSVVALFVGSLGALKLSGTVAGRLFNDHPQMARWAPLISYIVVFFITVGLIRLVGKFMQRVLESMALGWFNRIFGAVLYGFFISLAFGILLWLVIEMNIFEKEILEKSRTVPLLTALFLHTFESVSYIFPFVRSLFDDLGFFFDQVNYKLSDYVGAD